MPPPRRRRPIDASRMSHLVARPGIDTRRNLCLAQVVEVIVDPAEGIFIDVDLLPEEERETVQLTGPLAGGGFGFVCPVYADDIIVVGFPDGDPDAGPVLLGRLWNAGDPPPDDAKGTAVGQDAPGMYFLKEQVLLRAKAGENLLIRTSGAGSFSLEVEGDGTLDLKAKGSGRITIEQAGSADIVLKVANGKVCYVGDEEGAEPIALGQTLNTFLDSLKSWLDGHKHSYTLSGAPALTSGPSSTPATPTTSPTVPNVKATKGKVV